MRRVFLLTAATAAALLPCATAGLAGTPPDRNPGTVLLAQAKGTAPQAAGPQGTNLGTPLTQPQPGGSVLSGAGAPTSALPSAGGGQGRADAATQASGPPPPGSAAAVPLGNVTGSSQVGPTGAIVPGAEGAEPGTGGSQSSSTP